MPAGGSVLDFSERDEIMRLVAMAFGLFGIILQAINIGFVLSPKVEHAQKACIRNAGILLFLGYLILR